MKFPKTFVPEKNLEKSIETLLKHEELENTLDVFKRIEIESIPGEYSLFFDQSLSRIKDSGYERHLYPWEMLSLIMNHIENKLDGKLNSIAEEMLNKNAGRGHWLSFAAEIEGRNLNCYTNPQNLQWYNDTSKYLTREREQIVCDEKMQFDITGTGNKRIVDLNDFEEDFIKHVCGNSKSMISALLSKKYKMVVNLPDSPGLWPGIFYAATDQTKSYTEIWLSFHATNGLSQGVRAKQK